MLDGVVLVSPEQYTIAYAINPLTNKTSRIDTERARAQFEKLRDRFLRHRVPVFEITASALNSENRFPDFVFVSNSALILRGWPIRTVILSRFAKKERRGEEVLVERFLESQGIKNIHTLPEKEGCYFEGQGDCRWSHDGKHLWMAYGVGRSTLSGIRAVEEIILKEAAALGWIPPTIHRLHIVEPTTYHMDLCLLPLPNGRCLYHNTSFDRASQQEIEKVFGKEKCIHVPLHFLYGCNSVVVNDTLLIAPKLAFPDYRSWMRKYTGMHVEHVNVSEFELAGGSVSCLVLPLWTSVAE
jgi:N-dimethylarginine dimethylaminohydrolase